MERLTSPTSDSSEPPRSGIDETDRKEASLRSFSNFPFASDEVYQQGLADLAARDVLSGRSEVERADIILQMQLFYFNRVTGQTLTAEDVRPRQASTSNCQDRDTRPLTFAELKALIELGKTDTVPNNKVIPDVLNDAPPSTSIAPVRKKPWEVDSQS